jgi:hypothetical protein
VNPLSGQDEYETLETFFASVDLSFERLVWECFHTSGPDRPPRNPLGVFRAFIVMRMKGVHSLREMSRLLDVDARLRRLCLIKEGERGYPSREYCKLRSGGVGSFVMKHSPVSKLIVSKPQDSMEAKAQVNSFPFGCQFASIVL